MNGAHVPHGSFHRIGQLMLRIASPSRDDKSTASALCRWRLVDCPPWRNVSEEMDRVARSERRHTVPRYVDLSIPLPVVMIEIHTHVALTARNSLRLICKLCLVHLVMRDRQGSWQRTPESPPRWPGQKF
jgi:hypothetical protein